MFCFCSWISCNTRYIYYINDIMLHRSHYVKYQRKIRVHKICSYYCVLYLSILTMYCFIKPVLENSYYCIMFSKDCHFFPQQKVQTSKCIWWPYIQYVRHRKWHCGKVSKVTDIGHWCRFQKKQTLLIDCLCEKLLAEWGKRRKSVEKHHFSCHGMSWGICKSLSLLDCFIRQETQDLLNRHTDESEREK